MTGFDSLTVPLKFVPTECEPIHRVVGAWFPRQAIGWLLAHTTRLAEQLQGVRGVATPRGIVLSGDFEDLPWAPDVCYLVPHVAGQLWLRQGVSCSVAGHILLRSLRKHTRSSAALVYLDHVGALVALEGLGPVSVDVLAQWVKAAGSQLEGAP